MAAEKVHPLRRRRTVVGRFQRAHQRFDIPAGERVKKPLIDREVEHHLQALAVLSEVLHVLLGRNVRLREHDRVAPPPLQKVPQQMEHLEILARLDVGAFFFDQKRHRVDTKSGDAELQPESHDAHDLALHRRIEGVEIRLKLIKPMEVVLAGHGIAGPGRFLHAREYHSLVPVLRARLGPDIPVAIGRIRVFAGGLKPGMTIGRMVDHQIDDDAHADLFRVIHEIDELAERAVLGVDAVIVRYVVAVVAIRRGIERLEPHAGNAQAGEIVEPTHEAGEVADAVAVGIEVLLNVEAIDDRVLVPEIADRRTRRLFARLVLGGPSFFSAVSLSL